jgi:hypothetical protein
VTYDLKEAPTVERFCTTTKAAEPRREVWIKPEDAEKSRPAYGTTSGGNMGKRRLDSLPLKIVRNVPTQRFHQPHCTDGEIFNDIIIAGLAGCAGRREMIANNIAEYDKDSSGRAFIRVFFRWRQQER